MEDEELDQHALVKKLLEVVNASNELRSSVPENVAQLLTAALSQVIQSQHEEEERLVEVQSPSEQQDETVQRQYLTPAESVETTVEVSGYTVDQRPIGVKFPAEVRRKIIAMRKEGLKCKDIAKGLGASVSGVQKVWERFLATGTIRDRKHGTHSGRPRRYNPLKTSDEVYGL